MLQGIRFVRLVLIATVVVVNSFVIFFQDSLTKDSALTAIFLVATAALAWLLWRSFSLSERASTRCRLLLQHASDGIHILDAKGHLIEVSDSFCRMLGYTRAEMIGMNVRQWDAKVPVESLAQNIARAAEQREIVTLETCHRRKNGSIFDVEITSYPVDLDGQTVLYASARDITERKQSEYDRRIAAVAFESRQGMVVTDANSTIIRVNGTFSELTGYEPDEVVGKTPRLLKSGRHEAGFYTAMWQAIQQDGFWQGEIWNRRKNGEIYPEWLTITAVRDAEGVITHYVASFWDITRQMEEQAEILNLAFYDPLTGLANRRLLTDRLGHAFAKSSRSGSQGALLFIDLDRFKDLNDTLGHTQGDRLLELVADRLAVNVRDEDTVARFGGDEFVVLLEDLDQDPSIAADKALAVAEKLRSALNVPYKLEATNAAVWRCTPSIGVALFLGHNDEIESVLARADQGLYAAKEAGRNVVRLVDR